VVDRVAALLEADKEVAVRGKDNRLRDSNGGQISNLICKSHIFLAQISNQIPNLQ